MQPLEGTNDAGEEQSYDVIDQDRFGNPEEAAEASSLASVVWEAAAALDPKYRSVLLLNLREGLDSAEIAGVMGVTKNHAYVLVNRMKSALESAVGAVALFRNGGRHCAELDAVIERLQIAELSPEARRVIERHAGSCEICQDQRRKLASPFAIFSGFGLVQPAPGIKETIFGGLQEAFSAPSPAGGGPDALAQAQFGVDQGELWESSVPSRSQGVGSGVPVEPVRTLEPRPDAEGEGVGGWSKRRAAVLAGAAAVIMLLIGGPIAALSFFGSDEGTLELATIQETGTSTLAATPTASLTATPTQTQVAQAVTEPTETPTPEPGSPTAIEDDEDPGLAPGGGEPPTEEPPTAVPANPGPGEPGLGSTDDTGDDPTDAGSNLQPPAPDPPEPCAYSMSASTSELMFQPTDRSKTFALRGDACGEPLDVTLQPGDSWIIVTPTEAAIPIDGTLTVTVFLDQEDRHAIAGRVRVTSKAGVFDVLIKVEAPERTGPPPGGPDSGRGGGNDDDDGRDEPPCSSITCPPTPTPTPFGLTF
jgi:hypothetical protein